MFIPMLMPMIPTWNEKPPTLYSILESIVNFDKEEQTKIKDLAKTGRTTIFNFTYPLSTNVSKEDFECMILNHFIMRRIGFETVTAFRIQLNVKLNEIMPMYNKMFDMLEGWDIFNDGEKVTREVEDSRNIKTTSESTSENSSDTSTENTTNTSTSNTTNTEEDNISSSDTTTSSTLNNTSTTTAQNTSDNRNSDTPQNRLSEVRSGEYVDDYQYKQDNTTSTDTSTSTGSSTNSSDTTNNTTTETTAHTTTGVESTTTTGVEGQTTTNSEDNTENKGNTKETIIRTPSDKLKLYQDFIEKRQNIYTMIFKDLEDLFYQLV